MTDDVKLTEAEYQLLLNRIKKKTAIIKEQKTLLNLALDAGRVGLWSWDRDRDTDVLTWDRRMCEMWDVDFAEPKTYETFISRLLPEDQKRVQHAIDQCIAQNDYYDITYTIVVSDGARKLIHARGCMIGNKLAGVCFEKVY